MKTKSALIVLDIGTSSFKCGSIDKDLNIIDRRIRNFKIDQHGKFCELDFDECFSSAREVLKEVIQPCLKKGYVIEAILITSQAQTFAPVDKDFNPLDKGIVWLDTRAEEEDAYLSAKLPEFHKTAGFCKPLSAMYVSKFLWLKNNKPNIYRSASYFPLINEYIVFRLTGRFYSDYTNFGMGGILDIRSKDLNKEILEILGLSPDNFPEVSEVVGLGYNLTPQMISFMGLGETEKIPVYFCGNDQSASAIGAGVKREGDISVNFGTAMVLYTIIKRPPELIKPDQIVGISPITGYYFLICLDAEFGNVIDNLKARFFPDMNYDDVFSRFNTVRQERHFINVRIKNGEILYNKFESFDKDIIAGSVIKYFLERFKHHLSEIEVITSPENVHICGGAAQSIVWLKILQENCRYKITSSFNREAGLIGAARIYKDKCARGDR